MKKFLFGAVCFLAGGFYQLWAFEKRTKGVEPTYEDENMIVREYGERMSDNTNFAYVEFKSK